MLADFIQSTDSWYRWHVVYPFTSQERYLPFAQAPSTMDAVILNHFNSDDPAPSPSLDLKRQTSSRRCLSGDGQEETGGEIREGDA